MKKKLTKNKTKKSKVTKPIVKHKAKKRESTKRSDQIVRMFF